MMKALSILLTALAVALTACGGGGEEDTPTEQAPAEEAPLEEETPSADEPPGGEITRVPDVTGVNHQAAQDRLQAAGFVSLRERDCGGQDRLLLRDRNWVVQRQRPRAGTRVPTDRTIVLCSVKQRE